jgi:hypothetical protein
MRRRAETGLRFPEVFLFVLVGFVSAATSQLIRLGFNFPAPRVF